LKRLLEEKLRRTEISEEFVDSLEEKLVDFSVTLSQVEDKNLRNLLEFLFNYIVEKPNSTPWNRTIVKQFDLDPEDKTLRDDLRRFLYAVRLIKDISTDKQRIEKVYRF
jgi:hypothetical protein